MASKSISTKRLAISRASAQMVGAASVAAFVTVFALVSGHALLAQHAYRGHVINEKNKVNEQLKQDVQAVDSLAASYKVFINHPQNVLGATVGAGGDNDSNNRLIVLHALPSTYDFPAVTASLEKLTKDRNLQADAITGTDDQVAQQATPAAVSPQAVPIPFSLNIKGANYTSAQDFIGALEKSIRPFQIETLSLSGTVGDIIINITGHTYYQPGTEYKLSTKVIR